jgi:hypothetical protein
VAAFDFEFDFDYWRGLAEKDPAAFFSAREALLADFIASAPDYLRSDLQNLQRTIDQSRIEAGTPDRATRRLMGMMADHLAALAQNMVQLQDQSRELAGLLADQHASANQPHPSNNPKH